MEQPDQESQPTQTQVTTTSKSLNWKKIGLTVLIILVVTGLISGVYWVFVLNKDTEVSTDPIVPKPSTQTATESAKETTPSAEKDETADWKVYTNKDLGFSVKYPKEWNGIEEFSPSGPKDQNIWLVEIRKKPFKEYKEGEVVNITIKITKGNPAVQDYENEYKVISEKKVNDPYTVSAGVGQQVFLYSRLPDIVIDGLVGLRRRGEVKDSDSLVWVDVYLKKNSDYFKFYLDSTPKSFESNLKLFENMLSTFKFLPS